MAATFIILFKTAEGSDSTFVTSTKRAELAEADALNQFRAIDRFKDVEIDGFDAVAIIEKRHREIGTCRGCHHYENNCPFMAEQNKRGEFGYYPSVVCDDYKSREDGKKTTK